MIVPNPPTLASHAGMTDTTMQLNMQNGIHRLLLFVAVASTACGDGTQPPEHADVSGSWTYSATYSVTLGALGTTTCSGSGVQATITQSGSSVSGTARGGEWTCDSPALRSRAVHGRKPGTDQRDGRRNLRALRGRWVRPPRARGYRVRGFHERNDDRHWQHRRGGSVSVTGDWSASR